MKTETKDLEMETCPREGVVKKEKLPHNRKHSHRCVSGELWSLSWSITGKKKKNPQNTHLTTTTSREVAEILASATSEWGLGREAQAGSSVLRIDIRLG